MKYITDNSSREFDQKCLMKSFYSNVEAMLRKSKAKVPYFHLRQDIRAHSL